MPLLIVQQEGFFIGQKSCQVWIKNTRKKNIKKRNFRLHFELPIAILNLRSGNTWNASCQVLASDPNRSEQGRREPQQGCPMHGETGLSRRLHHVAAWCA